MVFGRAKKERSAHRSASQQSGERVQQAHPSRGENYPWLPHTEPDQPGKSHAPPLSPGTVRPGETSAGVPVPLPARTASEIQTYLTSVEKSLLRKHLLLYFLVFAIFSVRGASVRRGEETMGGRGEAGVSSVVSLSLESVTKSCCVHRQTETRCDRWKWCTGSIPNIRMKKVCGAIF